MKIGFWCREDTLSNNYVFFNRGEDACFNISHNIWVSFYEELKKINYNIQTIDLVDDISSLDCVIFLDFPAGKISPLAKKALSHKKKILITFENEVVRKIIGTSVIIIFLMLFLLGMMIILITLNILKL